MNETKIYKITVRKNDTIDSSAATYTLENLLKNLLERGHLLKIIEIVEIGKLNQDESEL